MLTKVKPARERILLIGGFGCGKSEAWCRIAYWMRKTKSPGKVYVVDTDHAALRLAEEYDDFFDNVIPEDVWDYKETKASLEKIKKLGPDKEDWLVVDLADKLWGWSQDHHISERFGVDALSYYTAAAKAGKEGHPLSGDYGMEWAHVNKHYAELMTLVQRFPGHVLFCTPAGAVENPNAQGKGGDSKEVRSLFGRYGVKPQGQKNLGFQFFTVLWMIDGGNEGYKFTTIKDLKRENVVNQKIKDFVMDYLVGIGGWVTNG